MLGSLTVITNKLKLNKDNATKPTAPPPYEDTKKAIRTPKEEPLGPEEEENLEEEATKYHNEN